MKKSYAKVFKNILKSILARISKFGIQLKKIFRKVTKIGARKLRAWGNRIAFTKTDLRKWRWVFLGVIVLLVGCFAYKRFLLGNQKESGSANKGKVDIVVTPKPQYSPWSKKELGLLLSKKTGIPMKDLIFDVTEMIVKNDKYFLYGALGEKGVAGGKHFYAVARYTEKVDKSVKRIDKIKLLYVGDTEPACKVFNGYDVPSAWLSRCKDM